MVGRSSRGGRFVSSGPIKPNQIKNQGPKETEKGTVFSSVGRSSLRSALPRRKRHLVEDKPTRLLPRRFVTAKLPSLRLAI